MVSEATSANREALSPLYLLLQHLISAFKLRLCVLWLSDPQALLVRTHPDCPSFNARDELATFLASYHRRFSAGNRSGTPVRLVELSGLSAGLRRVFERAGAQVLLISPVAKNGAVKGALLMGTEEADGLAGGRQGDLLHLFAEFAAFLGENASVRAEGSVTVEGDRFGLLIGRSPQMREVFATIAQVARSEGSVFICGETGTGKELVARMIHDVSERRNKPFIPIDCVALPGSLMESELFGFEKGAFTGATQIKRGLLEYAHRGTCFFDEITELHIDLQAKLLRVLQEREFRRLGGSDLIDLDIRIIAATNRDPREAIAEKRLREDLYFRLNVIPLHVPPLRERREDIPVLVRHFLQTSLDTDGGRTIEVSDLAMQRLVAYDWPGNVRELKNLIERLVALARGDVITVDDLPPEIARAELKHAVPPDSVPLSLPYNQAKEANLKSFEMAYFSRLIEKYHGNISRVAREAQVSRKTIYNILKKHGLNGHRCASSWA